MARSGARLAHEGSFSVTQSPSIFGSAKQLPSDQLGKFAEFSNKTKVILASSLGRRCRKYMSAINLSTLIWVGRVSADDLVRDFGLLESATATTTGVLLDSSVMLSD